MRIGLLLAQSTLSGADPGPGLRMACDLALALRAVRFVQQVSLVCDRSDDPLPVCVPGEYGLPLLSPVQAEAELDVVVQVDARLPPAWFARFDARGGSIVHLQTEPLYPALVEPSLFARPPVPLAPAETCESWIVAGDSAQRFLAAGLYRHPIVEMPFVYSDLWVRAKIGLASPSSGSAADQAPARGRATRLWILASNDRVGSMATLPLLACDLLAQTHPALIARVLLASASHLTDQATFQALVASCRSLGQTVQASEVRVADAALVEQGPFVVHALDAAIDPAWLDILVRGERLIHNCERLRHVGWFYPGGDPAEAAGAIQAAIDAPPGDGAQRVGRLARLLDDFSPANAAVQDAYARRLVRLFRGSRRLASAGGR